jgi:transposase
VNKITTLGIDLAKTVFQLHGVDWAGNVVLCREVRRAQLMKTIAQLEPCLIGIEACGGANYWARRFAEFGHQVKMMSPQFVKPYRKSDKKDRNDAEAICEAVTRLSMRFVAVKSVEQQDMLTLHRVREGLMKERVALINRIRKSGQRTVGHRYRRGFPHTRRHWVPAYRLRCVESLGSSC